MTISQLEDIRTDVGVDGGIGAGAIKGKAREVIAVDQPEVVLDGALTTIIVGTEPGGEPRRAVRDARNVRVSVGGVGLGATGGVGKL